jgi:hypothetical protein
MKSISVGAISSFFLKRMTQIGIESQRAMCWGSVVVAQTGDDCLMDLLAVLKLNVC